MTSLETPQRKWASSRLEGRTSWIFSSCGRCSRFTTGTSGTRSGGLRKGQSTCELLGGVTGFLSRLCPGQRYCVESVPEPEHSSPMQAWILEYFWSLPREVSPRLDWGHACGLSSRTVAACHASLPVYPRIGGFPSRLSTRISHDAFPPGFPTRLSYSDVPRATVVSVDPRLESRGSAGKSGFRGMD